MFIEIRTDLWYKKAGYKVYRLHNIFDTHTPKIFSKVSMMVILKLEDMGYYIFFVLLVCIIFFPLLLNIVFIWKSIYNAYI